MPKFAPACYLAPFNLDSSVIVAYRMYNNFLKRKDLPKDWLSSELCQRVSAWSIQKNNFKTNPFSEKIYVKKSCLDDYASKFGKSPKKLIDKQALTDYLIDFDLRVLGKNDITVKINQKEWDVLLKKYADPLIKCNNHYFRKTNYQTEGYGCFFLANSMVLEGISRADENSIILSWGSGARDYCSPTDLFIEYQLKDTTEGYSITRTILNPYIFIKEFLVL